MRYELRRSNLEEPPRYCGWFEDIDKFIRPIRVCLFNIIGVYRRIVSG